MGYNPKVLTRFKDEPFPLPFNFYIVLKYGGKQKHSHADPIEKINKPDKTQRRNI